MVKEYYIEGIKCSTLPAYGLRITLAKEDILTEEADENDIRVLLLKYADVINHHLIKWESANKVLKYKILCVDYFQDELSLFIRYLTEENAVPA